MGTERSFLRMNGSRLSSAPKQISQRLEWIDRSDRAIFVTFFVLAILLAPLGDIVLRWPVHINVLFAFFMIAAVWGHSHGLIGISLGTVVGTFVFGGNLFLSTIDVLSFVLGGAIVIALWHRPTRSVRQPIASLLTYASGTLCAVAGTVASASVLHEILGIRPVYVAMIDNSIGLWISALIVGAPLLGILLWASSNRSPAWSIQRRQRYSIAILSLGWGAIAFIGSSGYHLGSAVPDWLFERHGLGWAPLILDDHLFGVGAVRVQILVGSIVIVLLTIVIWTGIRSNREGEPNHE